MWPAWFVEWRAVRVVRQAVRLQERVKRLRSSPWIRRFEELQRERASVEQMEAKSRGERRRRMREAMR